MTRANKKLPITLLIGFLSVSVAAQTASEPQNAQQAPQNLQGPEPKSANINTAQLTGASKQPLSCPFCQLQNVDFSGKDLTDANLQRANLQGANLRGAILDGAELFGADLRNADLQNAKLRKSQNAPVDLSAADLTGAKLQGAELVGAIIEYAKLAPDQLKGAHTTGLVEGPRKQSTGRRQITAVTCGKADISKLTSRIYVSFDGTDSDTCGSSFDQSCKTISKGIARCGGNGCGVLVGWGQYQEAQTIILRDGVNVYGGCVPGSAPDALQSLIHAPPNGQPAIRAGAINNGVILQGFKIEGSTATSPAAAASVVLQVIDSAKLSVLDSMIIANPGSAGNQGTTGGDGATGTDASGASAGTTTACGGANGGNGSVNMNVSVDVHFASFTCNPSCSANNCYGYWGSQGAAGGKWGNGNCAECPRSRGDTGSGGSNGNNSNCGGKGSVSGNIAGSFSGMNWVASTGGAGSMGGSGGGGGGGGAGGYRAGACFWVKTEDPGNQGGGGASGGCPAAIGGGGQQGGASIALVMVNSGLTLTDSVIVGGTGGKGGNGGAGGRGGKGGTGAGGLSNQNGGFGGKGGDGGAGGAAGGGAGGNGGPAVGIALVANSKLGGQGTVYYPGSSGAVGGSGAGGQPIVTGACKAPDGDSGNPGLVANTQTY